MLRSRKDANEYIHLYGNVSFHELAGRECGGVMNGRVNLSFVVSIVGVADPSCRAHSVRHDGTVLVEVVDKVGNVDLVIYSDVNQPIQVSNYANAILFSRYRFSFRARLATANVEGSP
jgi:hypothetical protein